MGQRKWTFSQWYSFSEEDSLLGMLVSCRQLIRIQSIDAGATRKYLSGLRDGRQLRMYFRVSPDAPGDFDFGIAVEFQIKKPRNTRNTQKINPDSSMVSATSRHRNPRNIYLKSYVSSLSRNLE